MIVGITGAICSGKSALALYLVQTHGFEAVNVMEIFKLRLIKQREHAKQRKEKYLSAWKAKPDASSANGPEESKDEKLEENIENDFDLEKSEHELGLEPGAKVFCHAYY